MQSSQETALEDFMQRSFGAQYLYIPKKYRKGTAHREPADLAWVGTDFIALFYLSRSKEGMNEQIAHNKRQAAGYHRMWATRKTNFALRGKNRFTDECYVPYDTSQALLNILVISSECGIQLSSPITKERPNAVLVVPEAFIHWIAEFGGTLVDLLYVSEIFLRNHPPHDSTSADAFIALAQLVDTYVRESFSKADPERIFLSGAAQHDYRFLFDHIARMRLPAHFGGAIQSKEGREQISRLFGDFVLLEYASLAATAERAIIASEAPEFKKWVVLKIKGLHYSFVVGTVHMGARNFMDSTNAALEACKNEFGEIDSIYVQYGNVLDANEYRAPLLFTIPPKLPRNHASILVEKLLHESSQRFAPTNSAGSAA